MEQLLGIFGVWTWWIIAAILLVAELLVMSVFLVWFGIAALSVGLLALFLQLGWQVELLLFVVLSTVYVFLGRSYMKTRSASGDRPALPQPARAGLCRPDGGAVRGNQQWPWQGQARRFSLAGDRKRCASRIEGAHHRCVRHGAAVRTGVT